MRKQVSLVAVFMSAAVLFAGCGSTANNVSNNAANNTLSSNSSQTVQKDNASSQTGASSQVAASPQSAAPGNINFDSLRGSLPEMHNYSKGEYNAIDLERWFYDCGADDTMICATPDSPEGGVPIVGSFKASFGKWTIDVTTRAADPEMGHINIYTTSELAVINSDYSKGVFPAYNMTETDSIISSTLILDYLPKLVGYIKTCPNDPVIPYGYPELPIEKL